MSETISSILSSVLNIVLDLRIHCQKGGASGKELAGEASETGAPTAV